MRKIRKADYFELAIFCAHYHSGQWSRGYRLYCKLMGAAGHYTSAAEREAEDTEIYQYLVQNYAKSV